jgi:hypothetical protein
MFGGLKQQVTARLPESTLLRLVRFRNGELGWQVSTAARLRSLSGRQANGMHWAGRHLIPHVVHEYDAHQHRRDTARAIGVALDGAGVAYVILPATHESPVQIAVAEEDRPRATAALVAGLAGPGWAVAPPVSPARGWAGVGTPLCEPAGRAELDSSAHCILFRQVAAPDGTVVNDAGTGIPLDFWRTVTREDEPRVDGGMFEPGTRIASDEDNAVTGYLSPGAWEEAVHSPAHWPAAAGKPSVFQVREPIDVVYTWVDGDDPAWRARKAAVSSPEEAAELNRTAVHPSRFASRDELRYSLRSVAMYANWVRRIYLVTDQQVPPWLDTSHPKIQVVDHKQIFSDPSVLPVFNSHAIESQLHHIENLSDRYLYLNDDVFFGRLVQPELFFEANGLSYFFLSKGTLDIDPPSSRDLPVMSAAKRNRALIEERFGVTVTHKFKHTPIAQQRTVLEEMEKQYPELFAQVARSRFRHPDDYSITSALHHYYAYNLGRAVPGRIRYAYQDIARPDTERRLTNLLRTRDYDVFCLNDHETAESDVQSQKRILADFLPRYFPLPSPFEKAS